MPAPEGASTVAVIERALDDAIGHLSRAPSTPDTRSALLEARRLRSAVGAWHAIPPSEELRRQMLARVMRLTATVAPATSTSGQYSAVPSTPRSGPKLATPTASGAESGPAVKQEPGRAGGLRWTTAPSVLAAATSSEPDMLEAEDVAERRNAAGAQPAAPSRGALVVTRESALPWRALARAAGVSVKIVRQGEGWCSALARLDPGAELAVAGGASFECLVVDGSVRAGERSAAAGDHVLASPGAGAAFRTDAGCTLFLVGVRLGELA